MPGLYERLVSDIRFREGLTACINCGTCSAICPAAEFFDYDPREIADTVQSRDDHEILRLLKSDTIWYCGQCMSCKTRCPRNNTPGLIIIAIRSLSQEMGYFTESEKGRQQLVLKRTVGESVLNTGYCVHASHLTIENWPEQGPVWEWIYANREEVYNRLGGNYDGKGPGILRKINDENLDELRKIFDATGGTERFRIIEEYSALKATEMNLEFGEGHNNEYFRYVFTGNPEQNPEE